MHYLLFFVVAITGTWSEPNQNDAARGLRILHRESHQRIGTQNFGVSHLTANTILPSKNNSEYGLRDAWIAFGAPREQEVLDTCPFLVR